MVTTPKSRVAAACERLGRDAVIGRCAALLEGGVDDLEFILTLGGAPARRLIAAGIPSDEAYWVRVWAARGLLWAGPGAAINELRDALLDDHWRVREMACKVVARHSVEDVIDEVLALQSDDNGRVAAAATRAMRHIITARS